MKTYKISFSDIDWGEDDAKNDESLDRYFVEFPGFDSILNGKKRFVIGRKGTGKTAILQKIRLQSNDDPESFSTDVSLRDFPLTDFKALGDRSLQNKSKYVSAWKFLLLTEIANLLVQDCSIEDSCELGILRKFISDNFPEGISLSETISKLRENNNKVGFSSNWLSGERSRSSSTEITAKIHYNKAVKELEKLFENIKTTSTFILLVDELDEGYQVNNKNLNLVILSLLRASDELFNFFKNISIKCFPVLTLRSDIFDNLEDNDLNKLDDYVLRLDWSTSEKDKWSLKKIVEKRVEAAVKKEYPNFETSDYWSLVVSNEGTVNSLWQDMCIQTFSRPRDIIKLLKYCSSAARGSEKLTIKHLRAIETEYSGWFYREFRDEVQSFMACWKEALGCISEIGKGKAKTEELINRLDENLAVKRWCIENNKTSLDVIKILFDYSVIGCLNEEGRWVFKYKDVDFLEFCTSYPNYCIHYGFSRKLRIPKQYENDLRNVIMSL